MRLSQKIGQWKAFANEAIDRAVIFGKFLCVLHITDKYICSPIIVHGPSMLPTMNLTGDVVLAEHISSRFGNLSPGDVVLVTSPENPRKTVTKRILGMEGDKVTFLVDPNYDSGNYRTLVVPKGHVWIQGDNIYASKDSRHFGPVPYGLIHGKVLYRLDYMIGLLDPKIDFPVVLTLSNYVQYET